MNLLYLSLVLLSPPNYTSSVVEIESAGMKCIGVAISPFQVLTANHIVKGSNTCLVNGYISKVSKRNERADIAIVKTPFRFTRYPKLYRSFNQRDLQYGYLYQRGKLVKVKCIYNFIFWEGTPMIYVRADVRKGDSGSPIFSESGRVFGFVVRATRYSMGGILLPVVRVK